MSTKYLTIHCTTASDAPFIRCVIRITPDKMNSTTFGTILQDAITEHAPSNFTYVENDITSLKTKGGEALPIDILNDNVGELEQLFEDGEKWHIVVSFKGDAAVAAAAVKEEKMKEGVSASSSGSETATGTANNNNTDNNKGGNRLTIYVKADSGESVEFKVKDTMKMQRLFEAYAKSKNIDHVHDLRFFMDGDRIQGDDTPETLKLEDGDQIDCMLEQTGGL